MTMLDMARAYAAGGALVLPLHTPADNPSRCSCRTRGCAHPGKHPRTLNGLHDATDDAEKVRYWWGMWPSANIGIRPHPGQAVLDIDPRHRGDDELEDWQQEHGLLPTTRTARTGGGGEHRWFHVPGEVVGALAPGIDVKSNTGFLVAAPSVHVSGGIYEWTDTGQIAEAPPHLRRALARPPMPKPKPGVKATPAVVAGLLRVVSSAKEGNRNRALYWSCLRGVEHGVDLGPLVEAAVLIGLPRRAAEATARSATRRLGGAA